MWIVLFVLGFFLEATNANTIPVNKPGFRIPRNEVATDVSADPNPPKKPPEIKH